MAPKRPYMASRWFQDEPKQPQDGPKRASGRPRMAQEGPRNAQIGSQAGPGEALRELPKGNRNQLGSKKRSGTLPGPSRTPPGKVLGPIRAHQTHPEKPKSLSKLWLLSAWSDNFTSFPLRRARGSRTSQSERQGSRCQGRGSRGSRTDQMGKIVLSLHDLPKTCMNHPLKVPADTVVSDRAIGRIHRPHPHPHPPPHLHPHRPHSHRNPRQRLV